MKAAPTTMRAVTYRDEPQRRQASLLNVAGCGRKRSPPSPEERHRRHTYDEAAVHRSDSLRALRSARLAVDEVIRSLEHAASTAEKAFDSEVGASNETPSGFSDAVQIPPASSRTPELVFSQSNSDSLQKGAKTNNAQQRRRGRAAERNETPPSMGVRAAATESFCFP